MQFNVYETHMELFPYEKGDLPKLETRCSLWLDNEYRYDPIAYAIMDERLLIPRGIPMRFINKMTGCSPNYINIPVIPKESNSTFGMRSTPKNNDQRQAINFLISEDNYKGNINDSQFVLNVETGFGKTYCMINAIIKMNKRAVIIVHNNDIKSQWYNSLLKFTTMTEDNILDINHQSYMSEFIKDYSKDEAEKSIKDVLVVLITHSMITDYCNNNGWDKIGEFFSDVGIGVKVIDEVHLCLRSSIRIDLFTNIEKNYYLTATFGRSKDTEDTMFKRVFANANKFSGEAFARKHVNYKFIMFNSKPTQWQQRSITTNHGTSSYKYADYAFKEDKYKSLEGVMIKTINQCLSREGRTLIVVPKIENTFYLEKRIKDLFPNESVGVVNSKTDDSEEVKKTARIIVSTIKSLGVGADISKLRNIIIAEPHSSKIISNQLIGRLREYSSTDDTFAYELVDNGFPQMMRMIDRRYGEITKRCKKVSYAQVK